MGAFNRNMSLGIQNNNPGNLRPLANGKAWNGQTGVNQGFLVFDTMENGIRAMAIDLSSAIKNGYNTLIKFIQHYSPATDNNDPATYTNNLSEATGLEADEVIPMDHDTFYDIIAAIIQEENGQDADLVTDDQLDSGINKAEADRPNLYDPNKPVAKKTTPGTPATPAIQTAGINPWVAGLLILFLLGTLKHNSHAM